MLYVVKIEWLQQVEVFTNTIFIIYLCNITSCFEKSAVISRDLYICEKSLMAEWLVQASQCHEMYCHDMEVMSSNPDQVELGVLGTSVLSRT